jgi:hypothetical protein
VASAVIDTLRTQIEDLEREISEYEDLKEGRLLFFGADELDSSATAAETTPNDAMIAKKTITLSGALRAAFSDLTYRPQSAPRIRAAIPAGSRLMTAKKLMSPVAWEESSLSL